MHASQHFNRVRLAVPATRDLVCESKVALIECQQQRMLQKQSSKKKEREFQLQMRRSRIRGRSGFFSSSRRSRGVAGLVKRASALAESLSANAPAHFTLTCALCWAGASSQHTR